MTAPSTGAQLPSSPGRIDPTNPAFNTSRKPLAGEFMYHSGRLFVIANHFNSKGGDEPLFGRFQPPTRSSRGAAPPAGADRQRLRRQHPGRRRRTPNIVVLGDLNDFEFSTPLDLLEGGVLTT